MIFHTVIEEMLLPTSLLTRSLPKHRVIHHSAHCTFAAYTFTPMQIQYLTPKPFADKSHRIPYRKKQSAVHNNGLPFNILNFKFLLSFYRFVVATRHSAILNMLDLLLSYILRGEDLCPQTHSRGKHSNSRM